MNKKGELEGRTDEELVVSYLETQHSRYFDELYLRYNGKVFGKCLAMLKDEAKAQDAMQDIFIKIVLSLSRFNQDSRFSTWLYSITYNFCIDVIRKQKKMIIVELDTDVKSVANLNEPERSDAELLEIKINTLKDLLEKIPVREKVLLLMKYQDGMSIREIAENMDITESAVKMRLKRAKSKVLDLHEELKNKDDYVG